MPEKRAKSQRKEGSETSGRSRERRTKREGEKDNIPSFFGAVDGGRSTFFHT